MTTPINSPIIDATLRLRDGRALGYAEAGASAGTPVIHCHGEPSSRLEVLLFAEVAASLGVRLIGLDRPGFGRSDLKPGWQMLDWPDDVAEVADQLGIDRFAVTGFSGGGPFVLACAYKIPHRLTACGLISTFPPVSFITHAGPRSLRMAYRVLNRLPPGIFRSLVRRNMRKAATATEAETEQVLLRNAARLGDGDRAVVAAPEIRRIYAQTAVESYRQGVSANVEQALLLTKPWGFAVEDIRFPNIWLWHGEQDRIVPAAPVRLLAKTMPHWHATFDPETGHLSTPVAHARDILTAILHSG